MRKLFLLSVLFIFMGNVSANSDPTAIEVIEVEAQGETHPAIVAYCIADKVFVQYNNGTLTQVMDNHGSGTMATMFPMSCKGYKNRMKKRQG